MDINNRQFRYTRAIQLHDRYIASESAMKIHILPPENVGSICSQLSDLLKFSVYNKSKENGKVNRPARIVLDEETIENINKKHFTGVTKNIYDKLSNIVFRHLAVNLLLPFKDSEEYIKYQTDMAGEQAMTVGVDLRRRKCKIVTDDFVYHRLLGKGGFARVVHVMKRSTKQHLAMKIQSKAALLKFHGLNEGALELEKTMIANNSNPFIVDLHYALQTDNCAVLVLGLVGGGDLGHLIHSTPSGRLPESLAKVYCFEILLGLKHLHENGVVFRDLKPSNILVTDSGHLKLCDLGLAAPLYVNETIKQPPKDDAKLVGGANIEGEEDDIDSDGADSIVEKSREERKFYENFDKAALEAFVVAKEKDPNLAREWQLRSPDSSNKEIESINSIANSSSLTPSTRSKSEAKVEHISVNTSPLRSPSPLISPLNQSSPQQNINQNSPHNQDSPLNQNSPKTTRRARMSSFGSDNNYNSESGGQRIRRSSWGLQRGSNSFRSVEGDPDSYSGGKMENYDVPEWQKQPSERINIRRTSIVGTRAYLAPEMLEQTFEQERTGYTEMVDFFALGVTMFEMLSGTRPWSSFEPGKGNRSSEIADPFAMESDNLMKIIQLRQEDKRFPPGYVSKLHKVEYPNYFSSKAVDVISNLLKRSPDARFGYLEISTHGWLANISIQQLMSNDRSVIPEWVRTNIAEKKKRDFAGFDVDDDNVDMGSNLKPRYKSFEELMDECSIKDKNHAKFKWSITPNEESQKLFSDWDYISPQSIKDELAPLTKHLYIDRRLEKKRDQVNEDGNLGVDY